jgi:nucleotide-binding universal stress UspA family protein
MGARNRIVVPVDFSEPARAAAARAFFLADLSGAEVLLLHAYAPPPVALDPGVDPGLGERLRTAEEEAFERFCRVLEAQGRTFTSRFVDRDPPDAIHSVAREENTSLIVMGSHGRRGFDRVVLGSVAERTLHGAPVPVYVARESIEDASRSIRSILWATDFSKEAEAAEPLVSEWARRLGAEVEILHVIRETAVLFAPYAVAGSSDFEGEMMEAAERRMKCVQDRLSESGVSVRTKIVYGRAAESILERAESTAADLLIVGTRGYSAFRRFLLGSVAQRVVCHAPCSVVVAGARVDGPPR